MSRKLQVVAVVLTIALGLSSCSASPSTAPRTTAVASTKPAAATVSPYIGVTYPPLPSGWQDGRAALTASVGDVDYSVQEFMQADRQMLWFLKSTGRDAQGHAKWVVTDVLNRSDMPGPGGLIWGFCTLNDQPDEEIVALGEVKAARMDTIYRAWRANHATGRFEPMATTGIVCVAETIGP